MQVVHVDGLRDADEHAYRRLIKGMDAFEKYHALAPAASLRYRLYPRLPGVKADGTTLTIQGYKVKLPVALGSDLTFALPRDAQALDDNAQVSTNRKSRSFAWHPEVRSPGLPANARRLGDLRLECEIDRAAKLFVGLRLPTYYVVDAAVDICTTLPGGVWIYYADRAVFSVTLVHGNRREALFSRLMYGNPAKWIQTFYDFYPVLTDRTYMLRIADTSWPDDTLVELDYMDDAAVADASATQAMQTSQPSGTP
ncbi:hypothetical protein [Massilia sp. S19_KUP03_FR1]|uniref:hypothetical protein n=1 Tax=Massilia sp. S19_KUP03_FR1 TaxID=3025503 RepID=UPI002FCD9247